MQLNAVTPATLAPYSINVIDVSTNRVSKVPYYFGNENGYMFTVAAGRDYYVNWDLEFRDDPLTYT